ncbi:RAD50-interacting protein 1 [Cichlidogyrus casuarinus]|uniref:RAD50-interacting protein 1 n=1 Tax=Cichlidogyrus casuarinus TaxID=1844966 RepID=A0ABD2QE59_9PLAT
MQVVKALETRYKRIPCNSKRLPAESKAKMRFIRLMLELFFYFFEHLADFFTSNYVPSTLVQVNSQMKDRNRALYVSLNAYHAICNFIVELSNDPCYIQIWEDGTEKKILFSILDDLEEVEETEEKEPEVGPVEQQLSRMAPLIDIASKVKTVAATTLKNKTLELGSVAATIVNQRNSGSADEQNWHLDLGLFKRVHRVYLEQLDSLVEKARSIIIEEFKLHSHAWCKATDKWTLATNLVESRAEFCLSEEASPALIRLQNWFSSFKTNLHPKLFHRLLNLIAEAINQYLFAQLILSNKFSQQGANQLRYDLEKCLIPCFNYYYSNIQEDGDGIEERLVSKGESHFIDCLDACTLLTLKTAVAMLLQDSLKSVLNFDERDTSFSDPMAPLHDISVYHTLPDAALEILTTRLDLPC